MRRFWATAVVAALVLASCSSDAAVSNESGESAAVDSELESTLAGLTLDGEETSSITVSGTPLPQIGEAINIGIAENDIAFGMAAPEISGQNFDGSAASISNDGRAKVIYFVAHWCPHCQEEVPVLVDLVNSGQLPEDVDLYLVSTGVNSGSPNYPPSGWIASEKWPESVFRDDADSSTAIAFGIGGFPYAVYLDSDHNVVGRTQGRADEKTTLTLWNVAAGTAG